MSEGEVSRTRAITFGPHTVQAPVDEFSVNAMKHWTLKKTVVVLLGLTWALYLGSIGFAL
jgi:hypothetical protein